MILPFLKKMTDEMRRDLLKQIRQGGKMHNLKMFHIMHFLSAVNFFQSCGSNNS